MNDDNDEIFNSRLIDNEEEEEDLDIEDEGEEEKY